MTTEDRIQLLYSKLDYWLQPGKIDEFYANLSLNPNQPKFVAERGDTGYFYVTENMAAFYDLTSGLTVRLRKNWLPQDWDCYKRLCEKADSFKLDQLILQRYVVYKGETWDYAELQSPGNQYGVNCVDDLYVWVEQGFAVDPYLVSFVDDCTALMKACIEVATEFMCGVPDNICDINQRFRGPEGYFWTEVDTRNWNSLGFTMKERAIVYLKGSARFAVSKGYISEDDAKQIVLYAREQWKSL